MATITPRGGVKVNDMEETEGNISQKTKGSSKDKRGKSFYVALGICILAIFTAIYSTYTSVKYFTKPAEISDFSINAPVDIIQKGTNSDKEKAENTETKKYKDIVDSVSESKKDDNTSRQDIINSEEIIPTKGNLTGTIVLPAGNKIIKKYSGENPVYSKTFNDWRIHNGTDFALPQGSKVLAVTDGVVKDIFSDPMMGTTVVIEHEGDFTAFYSGLGKTTMVNIGDTIENGTEIGSIGSIPCETSDGEHLHLCIKRGDIYIDPLEILGKI